MSRKFSPDAVQDALIDLLRTRLRVSYGMPVDVQVLTGRDFNDDGRLIVKSPSVRLHYNSTAFSDARDVTKTTQQTDLLFSAFCRHESVRSSSAFQALTLKLAGIVCDELAGASFTLEDGSRIGAIELRGINQALDVAGPVDQVYAVSFNVSGTATFSGVNRNYGAQ
jgi:hypothetical protein